MQQQRDLQDFYLNTLIDRPEFLHMKLDNFPENVITQYCLMRTVDAKVFVILRVEKDMYGLPCADVIAQQIPRKRLKLNN